MRLSNFHATQQLLSFLGLVTTKLLIWRPKIFAQKCEFQPIIMKNDLRFLEK